MTELLLGIETGGTKVVAGVARVDDGFPTLVASEVVVSTDPDPVAVFDGVFERLGESVSLHEIAAVGIGSFGPVDLRAGAMLNTPKPGWSGFGLIDDVRRRLDVPVALDTDVNAAGLAEWRWGAARGTEVGVYLTVGTGIGGGVIIEGRPVHGLLHPEVGHVLVPRHPSDSFEGACGAHGDCFEGMTAGPALRKRWGMPGESLPETHPAWDLAAWYLGHGLAQITLAYSPEVVVMGGGVMGRGLHAAAEASMIEALGGYVPAPRVVPPGLGTRSGLMGAFALADEAAHS